jgi:hypothetical protein
VRVTASPHLTQTVRRLMKKQTIFDNTNFIARNEMNNIVSRIAPYSYWFQKITGEPLYSKDDVDEFLRQRGSPTKRAGDVAPVTSAEDDVYHKEKANE